MFVSIFVSSNYKFVFPTDPRKQKIIAEGSFTKYVAVGDGWVCAIFVTNCYENFGGWGCHAASVT